MGLSDIPVERRRAVYTCDNCRVREERLYDSPDSRWRSEELPWEHDWRLVPIWSADALAFCSRQCLDEHHAKITSGAYGLEPEPVKT